MTILLIILLSVSVFMILFGHMILSIIDKAYVYPKRLAKLQPPIPSCEPRSTPPEPLPPAMVSLLWCVPSARNMRKYKRSTRFTVTLLDLIHRGKIAVQRDGKKLYLLVQPEADEDLRPYEQILLNFIKDAARDIDRLSVARLKGYIEEHRDSSAAMRKRFHRELMSEFQSLGYYDELKRKSAIHPLMLIGGISVLASLGALVGWIGSNIPLGVITVCFAGFAGWLSVQVFTYDLPYLTDQGVTAWSEWDAYYRFLRSLKNASSLELPIGEWNRIAVYAAAMESNLTFQDLTKLWKNLPAFSLECELYDPYFYKKISEIDYAILISNAESVDAELFKQS